MKALLVAFFTTASLLGFEGGAYAANGVNHVSPGECGVTKFWQQGRCIDATDLQHRPGVPNWVMRKDMTWDEYIIKYGNWKQ
jgi:hypothetical protein